MTVSCREEHIAARRGKAPTLGQPQGAVTNRKFWIAGLANAFYSAAMALVLASMPFYVKYT